eukprot:scaffold122722_cov22-Tisochrysis_lutea.AAC.2
MPWCFLFAFLCLAATCVALSARGQRLSNAVDPMHSPAAAESMAPFRSCSAIVQVLSCDPLRVFIYKEGLTRICTEKYTKPKAENLSLTRNKLHTPESKPDLLQAVRVNKHNESFMAGNQAQAEAEAAASKWTLEQLAHYLRGQVGKGQRTVLSLPVPCILAL